MTRQYEKRFNFVLLFLFGLFTACGDSTPMIPDHPSTLKLFFASGYAPTEDQLSFTLDFDLNDGSLSFEATGGDGSSCSGSDILNENAIDSVQQTFETIETASLGGSYLLDGGTHQLTFDDTVFTVGPSCVGTSDCNVLTRGYCDLLTALKDVLPIKDQSVCPSNYSVAFSCVGDPDIN